MNIKVRPNFCYFFTNKNLRFLQIFNRYMTVLHVKYNYMSDAKLSSSDIGVCFFLCSSVKQIHSFYCKVEARFAEYCENM